MEPEAIPDDADDHFMTAAGWRVSPDEPHAGDVIEPADCWTDHETAVLEPQEEAVPCDFCSNEIAVAERGFIAADYAITADGETLAQTCHSCICDATVREHTDEHDPDEVYIKQSDFEGVRVVPDAFDPVEHPADKEKAQ